jgi:FKBP-type peptidyl-prolyl cis-trans isomerase FkpA
MKKIFLVSAAMMVLFSSCLHRFKKASEGLEYKVFSEGNGKKLANGDFFELWLDIQYKDAKIDTVLSSSENFGTRIIKLDSQAIPPSYYKIFSSMGDNDSAVVRLATDSIMKNGQAPPFLKKGEYVVWHYKIVNVFTTQAQADSAQNAQKTAADIKDSLLKIKQLAIDTKTIEDFLSKNNIKAVKGEQGTFVVINTPGTGPLIDTSVEVEVNYTGKSLDGKPFDSNIDPAFGHVTPFGVKMWLPKDKSGIIPGWPDGLKLLSKGAKATFYIPSALAYGAHGAGGKIGPNENLVFDIDVTDVIPKAQALIKDEAEQKKMELMRQHYMDSIRNTQPQQQQHP